MNALSGKVIQRVFTEEKRFCMNDEDTARCLNNLNVHATSSVGNITLVSGEIKHPIVKVPSIWSVLTYSYTHSYMYENVIMKSTTKLASHGFRLLILPRWKTLTICRGNARDFGDKPGQMKEELGKDKYEIFKVKEFHIVYSYGDDGKEIPYKVRWKGVHETDRAILDEKSSSSSRKTFSPTRSCLTCTIVGVMENLQWGVWSTTS